GMAEPRNRARLALEALLVLGVARRLRQHDLERDRALEDGVEGLVDGAHSAASQQLHDLVLADLRTLHDRRRARPGRRGRIGGGGRRSRLGALFDSREVCRAAHAPLSLPARDYNKRAGWLASATP